ncbi:phage portal protein [Govanella unica]|uniref:Phage portal protein n=1 Tax=Govanella unica TaxID=2975056 RepID=A0A9X3U0C3_9PROT|nr:phage portal protein [Govania unica]MDA5194937.1 phage portal protein [Govania unica]
MSILRDLWRASGFEVKKSAALGGSETAFLGLGAPRWTQRNFRRLAEEGFRKNVIAHRSIKVIAESAAAVPWRLGRGDKLLRGHPLLDLLARPNPAMSGLDLMESLYAYLNIAGDAYLEMVPGANGRPGELYVLRPDRMTILPGANGWPRAYRYEAGGRVHEFEVDGLTGESRILHVKYFHPLDDLYGMSPLEAAAYGIDIHNAASQWNKALFDNAARPSGALVYDNKDGATLSEGQFERLKADLAETYQGARNAGRPLLLEGGLSWQPMAFSPQDMEFAEGKNMAAREIALAFGVPPLLLNIPGDNTYNNYQEANRALWRLTLLPLMEKMTAALNHWLTPQFGRDLWLDFDRDSITALQSERTASWERLAGAHFLTINEKRLAAGLEPVADGDKLASG